MVSTFSVVVFSASDFHAHQKPRSELARVVVLTFMHIRNLVVNWLVSLC
jgi:hypothetical protein